MLQKVKCNLCGWDKYRVLYKAKGSYRGALDSYTITDESIAIFGRIVQCHRCGLIYVNPRFDLTDR